MAARAQRSPVNRRDGGGQLTFDQLYEQLWWPMLRMAVGLVDDVGVAEDVVQDAFAAVHRRWDFIRSNQALVSYLRTAVVNGARSTLRRRGTARKHLHLVSDQTDQPSDHRLMLSEEHRAVRAAFAQLPERQRTVLTLRYISELSDAEIATATGLSTGGVRSAASRGLSSLRASLGGLQ